MLDPDPDAAVASLFRRRPPAIDIVLFLVIVAVALPATFDAGIDPHDTVADTLLLPLVGLPILLRRARPSTAAALFAAACAISALPTLDQFRIAVAIPAGQLVAYSTATHDERGRAVRGLLLVFAGLTIVGATEAVLDGIGGTLAMIAFAFPVTTVVWGAGRSVRAREHLAAEVAERSARLERRREQTAALAIEVERTRLATDLEGVARGRLERIVTLADDGTRDPAAHHDSFAQIEALGREALDAMRSLLGSLRSDERGPRLPRPTLAELDELLIAARAGGRPVALRIDGERRPLPAGVELVAYRAVQHTLAALTAEDHVAIRLGYADAALELEISGTPRRDAEATAALAAARERIAVLGGTFRDEHAAEGPRHIFARLPLAVARA